MSNCCNDYTRSQLLRSAAAEAGRGLPAIEVGMPEPAGTGLSRRRFISWSAGLALAVYGASKIPLAAFEEGIARAAGTDKILISVFFDGGMDALSVLAPTGDPRYSQLRPNLALAPGAGTEFSEDPTLRWHPSAAGLATLHEEGKVSAFPAIGYDHPDQSHFTSRHYYEIGELDVGFHTGWLGRYIDQTGEDDNPLQGLSMDGSLSPMIATAERPVAAIDSVDGYDLWSPVSQPISDEMYKSFARFGSLPSDSAGLAQVRRATAQTDKLRTDLGGIGGFTSPVTYPDTGFSHKLAGLAAFIDAGLPMRVVTIRASGGYDTHADEAEDLSRGLLETCEGILAFQRDLEKRGLADRVLIEMWSEFGRRPEENASLGTDHGAAGCAFVVGSKAKGEMVGEFPGLAQLDQNDNVRVTSDFRAMYCSLLEQWLGHDAASIIPGRLVLRPPDPGEGVSGSAARRLRAGLALLTTAAIATGALALAVPAASAEGCTWQRHSKSTVKQLRRRGRPRRVKRVKHWWTCETQPAALPRTPPCPARPRPTPPPKKRPRALPSQRQSGRVEIHPLPPRSGRGRNDRRAQQPRRRPHNLQLQREGRAEPPLPSPRSLSQRTTTPPRSKPAPTTSTAASSNTRQKACTRRWWSAAVS